MDTFERELFQAAFIDKDREIERLERMVDLQERLIVLYEGKIAFFAQRVVEQERWPN